MKISVILQGLGEREVATISANETIGDAVKMLAEKRIGALVVSEGGGEIAGIISERDIIQGLGAHGASLLGQKVSEMMTANVETTTVDSTAIGVLGRMTRGRFRHMPIVDGDGRLTGIMSIGDAVKARLEEIERENKAMAEMLSY